MVEIKGMTNSQYSHAQYIASRAESSDYAKFQFELRGIEVIQKSTGKPVPKYILWHWSGCEYCQYSAAIMEHDHPEYIFIPRVKDSNLSKRYGLRRKEKL